MSAASRPSPVTPEEYLALERAATHAKHELVNGRVYALASASRAHNTIAVNLTRVISTQLRGRSCQAFGSDMRVKVPATGMYTYPDLVVACGEPRFEDGQVDTLLDPTLVVEILSPTTEAYDRGGTSSPTIATWTRCGNTCSWPSTACSWSASLGRTIPGCSRRLARRERWWNCHPSAARSRSTSFTSG